MGLFWEIKEGIKDILEVVTFIFTNSWGMDLEKAIAEPFKIVFYTFFSALPKAPRMWRSYGKRLGFFFTAAFIVTSIVMYRKGLDLIKLPGEILDDIPFGLGSKDLTSLIIIALIIYITNRSGVGHVFLNFLISLFTLLGFVPLFMSNGMSESRANTALLGIALLIMLFTLFAKVIYYRRIDNGEDEDLEERKVMRLINKADKEGRIKELK